jgi:PAS domain S-box-containing protein
MLEEIIHNPSLHRYLVTFEKGTTIFLEGDASQDLYILVSGQLDIYKGIKIISSLVEEGSLFGETSFLLGTKRTATVKARDAAHALRIPKEEVAVFLHEFPAVAGEISTMLAHRLDEANQVIYGLKEFCDQLPDAVVLTDKNGKIISWNIAAGKLYGRSWNQMRYKAVEEMYEEPDAYRAFIEEVRTSYPVSEKIFKIRHPIKGTRFVSTSTTVLFDGHHHFQGMLSLARDVTSMRKMEEKYRRARYWLTPCVILLVLLSTALFFTYPHFTKSYQLTDERKRELRNQIAKDYLMLTSLLTNLFEAEDRKNAAHLLEDFFAIQDKASVPYTGVVVLDRDKKVFLAYSITPEIDAQTMVGSSYAGIEFHDSEQSKHKVLNLFRVDHNHPMGRKGIEIAFAIEKENRSLGWLIFQMNVELLKQKFGIEEKELEKFCF